MIDFSFPLCETYTDAIASSSLIKTPPNGWVSGCLYDRNGAIIALSQRFGGFHGDFFPNSDDETITTDNMIDLPVLRGKSLYLGHFMPHYGHFLVEMLSSFWMYDKFSSFDHFVFHPFVFGETYPSYLVEAFKAFGLPLSKIHIIKTQTILAEVTIPERLVKLNKSAKNEVRKVYQFLTHTLSTGDSHSINRCYYISRVRMSLRSGQRVIINEPIFECVLNKMGFETIYPELLSLAEQVSLFNQADIICGLSGSALHNCVFMRPHSLLIEIADLRSRDTTHPMQMICNNLSNITYHLIPFSGLVIHQENQLGSISITPLVRQIESIVKQYRVEQGMPNSTRAHSATLERCRLNTLMIMKNSLRLLKWVLIKKILRM
jgi:capsular polysaccharide biosynthesis protein